MTINIEEENKRSFLKDPTLKPIEVYGTIIALLFDIYGFYESNKTTLLSSINATLLEFTKIELEKDYISCLYPFEDSNMIKTTMKMSLFFTIIHGTKIYIKTIRL